MSNAPFEIKNYRLIPSHQQNMGSSKNPNIFVLNNEEYQLSEQFNSLYLGYNLINLGQVKYKGNSSLDSIVVDFQVYLEESKLPIMKNRATFQNITKNSSMRIPCELELRQKDNYIFHYVILYKEAPFVQNNQQDRQIQEQKWSKKFRIQPSYPFEIQPPRLCPWLAPNYYLEYCFVNISKEPLELKEMKFEARDPFEAIKIQNSEGNLQLQNNEKENLIFKISVQPQKVNTYSQICAQQQDQEVNIGKVKFQWGTCGFFEGKDIPLKIKSYDLNVDFSDDQELQNFSHEKIHEVKIKIHSPIQRASDIRIHLEGKEMSAIKIVGTDIKHFSLGPSNEQQEITLYILPILSGIQHITGLYFIQKDKRDRKFIWNNNLCIKVQSGQQEGQLLQEQAKQPQQQIVEDLI